MSCSQQGCAKEAEQDSDICFRHRVLSVGVSWMGGARPGRTSWNQTRSDFMIENLGTTDDRELGKRGIERLDKW